MNTIFMMAPAYWPATVIALIFGLIVGSFLNVVIYRIPKMMQRESDNYIASESGLPLPHTDRFNLMLPRSACPHCGHQIRSWENIPVISYLFIRGQCTQCRTPISLRYPLVETVTGLLSAFTIWHFGSGMIGLAALLLVFFLIALTMIDADTQLLPDDLTLPLLWCGLLVNLNAGFASLSSAVIGAAAGYLSLWLVYWAFKLLTGKEGMGYGDFKLLAALGAWMGWQMLPVIILLSSLVGAVVGIALIMLAKAGRNTALPFGPYLAGAGLLTLYWGPQLTTYYLALLA